jgi:hypothetical protein
MSSSDPSAAREKPFISGRNSSNRPAATVTWEGSHSPSSRWIPESAARGDSRRVAAFQLPRALATRLGHEPVGGVRPASGLCATHEAVTAGALEAIALARPPVSRVLGVVALTPSSIRGDDNVARPADQQQTRPYREAAGSIPFVGFT